MQALSAHMTVLPRRNFAGTAVQHRCIAARPQPQRLQRSVVFAAEKSTALEFIRGVTEPTVPDVNLTRSKDGSNGTATFVFKEPTVFEGSEELGEITGLFMRDTEGELSTIDVQAKFVNGKPDRIEARYVMRSPMEWDRFMRFMERYSDDNGLGFNKA